VGIGRRSGVRGVRIDHAYIELIMYVVIILYFVIFHVQKSAFIFVQILNIDSKTRLSP